MPVYLHFTVQEGIGFPEVMSNNGDLESLGKLTDIESSDPALASMAPPCRHPVLTQGHPQPILLQVETGSGFHTWQELPVSAGSKLDQTPNSSEWVSSWFPAHPNIDAFRASPVRSPQPEVPQHMRNQQSQLTNRGLGEVRFSGSFVGG